MTETVLITDGDQRSALACVRSLGAAGYRCVVLEPALGTLAGSSRFCQEAILAPDPIRDASGFVMAVVEQAGAQGADFLLPVTEKSLRALLPVRHRLPGVKIPFPQEDVFSRVSDKSEVLEAAGRIGLKIPAQWEFRSLVDLEAAEIPRRSYPLVLKPTRSVSQLGTDARQVGVRYARNPADLRAWCRRAGPAHFPVLIQERIIGHGAGVFLLTWDGVLRAVVGHRRLREKPPSGGVSVLRESTIVDPTLLDKTHELLAELGWTDGVAMVEYKVEESLGTPYLMEINGRFWGSLQMAIDSGVDFPTLLLRCASGEAPSETVVGRPGVKTRWLMGDMDQLLMRTFRRRKQLNLPPHFPGRGRGIMDFLLGFRPGVRTEVLRVSDLRPFLVEVRSWLGDLL